MKRKRDEVPEYVEPAIFEVPCKEVCEMNRLICRQRIDALRNAHLRSAAAAYRFALRAARIKAYRARERRKERRRLLKELRRKTRRGIALIIADNNPRPRGKRARKKCYAATGTEQIDQSYYGLPPHDCRHCHAPFYERERVKSAGSNVRPVFSLCCQDGKIKLPPRREPPEPLRSLLNVHGGQANRKFVDNIRAYNSLLAMTSSGAKIDDSINGRGAPYIYRISGENYHRIGTLLPAEGARPSFLQLYIYDTANEVRNRLNAVNQRDRNERLDPDIIRDLIAMLDENNKLVQVFRMARDRYDRNGSENMRIRLIKQRRVQRRTYTPPTASEIAVLIVSDATCENAERDLIVEPKNGPLRRISDLQPSFMALQYPLLFPYAEDGFHPKIPYFKNSGSRKTKRDFVTAREYYSYILQHRRNEGKTLQASGRLYQQYIVDAYTQVEQQRLRWLRKNQGSLRTDLYQNIYDAFQRGDTEASEVGMRTILPASFTGGLRYMINNYQDAMAICRAYGNPDFFITFTANPKWREIEELLSETEGQTAENRPDIESRIFKMKLEEMMHDIVKNQIFGKVEAVLYTIEFQKRGLPHAHIIFWVDNDSKLLTTDRVDEVISAEIPDPKGDPVGYAAVSQFMMHGPCGPANVDSPCMIEGSCSKNFPRPYRPVTEIDENGFCSYRRRPNGRFVDKGIAKLDNGYVTPYNRYLIIKYQSHINVEACNKSKAIKYLFKYVTKGPDMATAVLECDLGNHGTVGPAPAVKVDEIKRYLDCRYISACEAIWRLYEFPIHYRTPSVVRLCYHLKDEQQVIFCDDDEIEDVIKSHNVERTMFTEWFELNKVDALAREKTYVDIPRYFVWIKKTKKWQRRKSGKAIGRLTFAHPASGERYYLRLLLNVVKGATSFEQIRTVDGVEYPTMKAACHAREMLGEDVEWNEAMQEATQWGTSPFLRNMFLTMLLFCDIADVKHFWDTNWPKLGDDILHLQRKARRNPRYKMSPELHEQYTLAELGKMLQRSGRSLSDIQGLPPLDEDLLGLLKNKMVSDELSYDSYQLEQEHDLSKPLFNSEQLDVYEKVINAVQRNESRLFFLYGFGGTGKTFLYKTIINKLRSEALIVLAVASSGIAALLLPGGRTAHSRFRIPLNLNENSTCIVKHGTQLAELLQRTSLVIWDEAPMDNKHAFEAVDRTLKDILARIPGCGRELPFGGRCFLLGGDFRQILPVVPGATRGEIVNASLNRSYLWKDCEVCVLTKNMRVQFDGEVVPGSIMDPKCFSDWILRIENGTEPARARGDADEAEWIKIPEALYLKPEIDTIKQIFESTYPRFDDCKYETEYLTSRAILTPRNATVDDINTFIMEKVTSESKEYISYDCVDQSSGDHENADMMYPVEFLNSLSLPGMPDHVLKVKIGVPIMLLRNLNPSMGLCNGTRMIITHFGKRVIGVRILSGSHIGEQTMIHRIILTSTDSKMPFILRRRQFPVRVCYAMTINKSQGQTLENVRLYLPQPVFSHGQFYVAISRVRAPEGLKILCIEDDDDYKGWTKNIVYKEVFNNIAGTM